MWDKSQVFWVIIIKAGKIWIIELASFRRDVVAPLLLGEGRNPLHGSVKERATKNKKEEKEEKEERDRRWKMNRISGPEDGVRRLWEGAVKEEVVSETLPTVHPWQLLLERSTNKQTHRDNVRKQKWPFSPLPSRIKTSEIIIRMVLVQQLR